QFSGQIRHQENRAFRNVLDLDIENIDHVSELAAETVVLVDHNQPRGFEGAHGVLPFAVVDHHPGEGTGEEFTDVRTDYGATASIVAEYFVDVGGKPVPPDVHESEVDARFTLPSRECTGLLYGILADTRHLTSGVSGADFSAAASLAPGVDEDALDRIANPQVSGETLDVKARAIAGRQVEGSFAVSDVGTLSNADAIPQAAEELITLEGITAVVVVGERNGTVHLSGRSRDDRVHMGRALENAVEGLPDAGAGGHARMGGGQFPADEEHSREALIETIFDSLEGDV
ncbi:MAG: DHH family phosphoesterase, partial [Halolamina sp.]